MRSFLITALITVFATFAVAEETWTIDTAHTELGFAVKHLGISNTRGVFSDFGGEVKADKDGKLETVTGNVKIASIDTRNKMRDDHLRGADFFDAEKHPEMTFKSKSVKFDGSKVTLVGDLTIKGVTKSVTLTGEFNGTRKANFGGGDMVHAGYEFSGKINRQDFGLTFNKLVDGAAVVGDEVKLELHLEIVRKA